VHADVDDHAGGSQRRSGEHAQPRARLIEPAELVGQPLGIKSPALAASAYGRSVPVSSATVNTTNSTTGSVIAENVFARLDPSCAYGLPVSTAAVAMTKLASDSRKPPPRMSPMYPSGSP
jgi:hypothetical protein